MECYVALDENNVLNSLEIRKTVFLEELNFLYDEVFDYDDTIGILFTGYLDDLPCSSGRIILKDGIAYLSYLGTLKDYRLLGSASLLLKTIINYLKENTIIRLIVCKALVDSKEFFLKKGFKEESGIFIEDKRQYINFSLNLFD